MGYVPSYRAVPHGLPHAPDCDALTLALVAQSGGGWGQRVTLTYVVMTALFYNSPTVLETVMAKRIVEIKVVGLLFN